MPRQIVTGLTIVLIVPVLWASCSKSEAPAEPPPPKAPRTQTSCNDARQAFLDIMKLALTDLLYEDDEQVRTARIEGRDWPGRAHTMIGIARLQNLEELVNDVLDRHVPGDLIEAGVWRGGATIFMRAILESRGVTDRLVWVADSFEGLPVPNARDYPADAGMDFSKSKAPALAVSRETVAKNFARYGLLDNQVRFLKGWFKDTLPSASIKSLAILRIDADLYESTTDALKYLYPKLSPGGYVIIDDVGAMPACKKAVNDYRDAHGINAEIKWIDWTGVYWKKTDTVSGPDGDGSAPTPR